MLNSNIFIEITKSEHIHGGPGWQFGTCLWSPSVDRGGRDRYHLMRDIKKNDIIMHFYLDTWTDGKTETRIAGQSKVVKEYIEVTEEPPSPGEWANMSPYYKVQLTEYSSYSPPISLHKFLELYTDEVRTEIIEHQPKYYPFSTYRDEIRTVQGMYIAKCTPTLYTLMQKALGLEGVSTASNGFVDTHHEYIEGKRYSREVYFWARNKKLVDAAKKHYGYSCQICGFNFKSAYGIPGENFIECHHLNPLSERPDKEWDENLKTDLNDVAVLCSNCHRMIHRKKPAYSIEEVKGLFSENKK